MGCEVGQHCQRRGAAGSAVVRPKLTSASVQAFCAAGSAPVRPSSKHSDVSNVGAASVNARQPITTHRRVKWGSCMVGLGYKRLTRLVWLCLAMQICKLFVLLSRESSARLSRFAELGPTFCRAELALAFCWQGPPGFGPPNSLLMLSVSRPTSDDAVDLHVCSFNKPRTSAACRQHSTGLFAPAGVPNPLHPASLAALQMLLQQQLGLDKYATREQ